MAGWTVQRLAALRQRSAALVVEAGITAEPDAEAAIDIAYDSQIDPNPDM